MKPARRGLAGHLALGIALLHTRIWARLDRWRRAGTRRGDRAIRTGCLILAALITLRVLTAAWQLLLAAMLTVIVTALRTATRHVRGQAPEPAAAPIPEDVDDPRPADPSPAEFVALVHRVIGTAGGVHLATLARALTAEVGGAWEIADVRRLCEAAGQPTRPTVRAPGAGPTVGIKREDLLPLPQQRPPVPDAAVVDAGQPPTTGPTTPAPTTPATATTVHGGLRVTTTPDPDNPHRHAVRVLNAARRRRS